MARGWQTQCHGRFNSQTGSLDEHQHWKTCICMVHQLQVWYDMEYTSASDRQLQGGNGDRQSQHGVSVFSPQRSASRGLTESGAGWQGVESYSDNGGKLPAATVGMQDGMQDLGIVGGKGLVESALMSKSRLMNKVFETCFRKARLRLERNCPFDPRDKSYIHVQLLSTWSTYKLSNLDSAFKDTRVCHLTLMVLLDLTYLSRGKRSERREADSSAKYISNLPVARTTIHLGIRTTRNWQMQS